MNHTQTIKHVFVEYFPDNLEERTLYVSINFASVAHKCGCGCGHEVITPLSPTGWSLFFDGVSISLHPSIGNWGFPCKSHYWIRNNHIMWVPKWSSEHIASGKTLDRHTNRACYKNNRFESGENKEIGSIWQKLKNIFH